MSQKPSRVFVGTQGAVGVGRSSTLKMAGRPAPLVGFGTGEKRVLSVVAALRAVLQHHLDHVEKLLPDPKYRHGKEVWGARGCCILQLQATFAVGAWATFRAEMQYAL